MNVPRRLLAALALAALARAAAAQSATPAPKLAATPPAGDAKEGKALFAKVVESMGGKQKVETVKDVQTRGELTAKTPEGDAKMDVQTAIVFPDKLSQQVDSPFGRFTMVATPDAAFLVGPPGSQDLPDSMKQELLKQVRRVPLYLAQKIDDPKLSVVATGSAQVQGVEAKILEVRYGDASVRWFVDPKTGRILRTVHTATGPDGQPLEMSSDYLDYRNEGGFPIAHRLEVTTNGEKDQTLVLEECKINAGVDPALFRKPPPMPTPVPTSPPPAPGG
jgi:outer membrane lipoprotein-sorting protein